MLLPYRDINPTRRFPAVTVLLIMTNVLIFYGLVFSRAGFDALTAQFALIPYEIHNGNLPGSEMLSPWITLGTYMFMHGGFGHLAFNMLFLWIFGNNIEDRMTRSGFLLFYLLVGVLSGLAFELKNPGSRVSLVGASGAISGVLGAYLLLFPFARVHALFFIFPVRMPAVVFLVIWFITQIAGFRGAQGNVAWISHISGFIAGIVLHRFFLVRQMSPRY